MRPSRPYGGEAHKLVNLTGFRDYQCHGASWISARLSQGLDCLLGDDMRLGKTPQTLRALPRRCRVIVVCPKIAVHNVWVKEVHNWRPDLRATWDEPLRRPAPGEVLIITYDQLPDPLYGERSVADDLSDVIVILDEVQYVMNEDALRTRRVYALIHTAGWVIGLTGTPLVGHPKDLWGVLRAVRLDKIFKNSREFMTGFSATGDVAPWVYERLRAGGMLRRTQKEVDAQLPEEIYQSVEVDPPPNLREYLDEQFGKWDLQDPYELPAWDGYSELRRALAEARIPTALEVALTLPRPLVVLSFHQAPVLAMRKLASSGAIVHETPDGERDTLVDAFRRGRLEVLALTPRIAGVAIDLSRASTILRVDRDWTPGVNLQALARTKAVGKLRGTLVVDIFMRHPLDRRVEEILEIKTRRFQQAMGEGHGRT